MEKRFKKEQIARILGQESEGQKKMPALSMGLLSKTYYADEKKYSRI